MNLKKLQQSFKLCRPTIGAWLNDLKCRIKHFDIKPQPPIIGALLQQASAAQDAGEYLVALEYLRSALRCNSRNYTALVELSNLCVWLGKAEEGLRNVKWAIRNYPESFSLYKIQGLLYAMSGDMHESAISLKRALQIQPDSPNVRHILDGVEKNHTKIAPREYVVGAFDGYADSFDEILLGALDYRSHIELAAEIGKLIPNKSAAVLDLGCGTGLFGRALFDLVTVDNLVGVDLSSQMLAKCTERNIYAQLHTGDLIEFLQTIQEQYDFITAADVFVYIGDLSPVFEGAYQRLVPGGYFAFTVEALPGDSYVLTHTGRYQHSLKYLTTLQKLFGYSTISAKTIDLRKEYGNIVSGYLVLLQK